MAVKLHGHSQPRFDALLDAFRENFSDNGEIGARVTVIQEGETVFNRWGDFDISRDLLGASYEPFNKRNF